MFWKSLGLFVFISFDALIAHFNQGNVVANKHITGCC